MWGEEMVSLEGKAAGHEGMLQDPGGSIIIKPTNQQEVDFYQFIVQQLQRENLEEDDPAYLGYVIPRFLGTLKEHQAGSNGLDKVVQESLPADSLDVDKNEDTQQLEAIPHTGDILLVLENCLHGFVKPAVMDVKLGKRLWDHSASLEKRHRLEQVSSTTTSGSLGFRIAGMRTWEAKDQANPHLLQDVEFTKFFGRQLTPENIVSQGLARFLHSGNLDTSQRKSILQDFIKTLQQIEITLYHSTSVYSLRLCSSSLLFIFESVEQAYTTNIQKANIAESLEALNDNSEEEEGEEEDDDEDDELTPVSTVKLIDFAHATFLDSSQINEQDTKILKGQTKHDENTLQGIRNLISCLNNQVGYYLFPQDWKPLA